MEYAGDDVLRVARWRCACHGNDEYPDRDRYFSEILVIEDKSVLADR
jgi:hypothetical protein